MHIRHEGFSWPHLLSPWKKTNAFHHLCLCVFFFCTFHLVPSFRPLSTLFRWTPTDQYICNAINWIQRNVCVRANGQMFVCSTKRKNLHTVLSEMDTLYLFIFHSFFSSRSLFATSCAVSSSVNCFIRF